MNRTIILASLSFLLLSTAGVAHAGCDAGLDACAPKKTLDAWNKSMSAGFNLTRGNSETLLINLGGAVNREDSSGNIWDIAGVFNYGEDTAREQNGQDKVSRNDARGSVRYDRLLSERLFIGTGFVAVNDEIADVNYRVNLDISPGYYVLKNSDHKLRFEAGPGVVFEKVSGETDSYFSPRVGERWDWVLTCTSKIFQKADVTFDIDESKNYLLNAEAGIEAAISSSMALVLSVRNQYDGQPALGRDKNDVQVTTALKISL